MFKDIDTDAIEKEHSYYGGFVTLQALTNHAKIERDFEYYGGFVSKEALYNFYRGE